MRYRSLVVLISLCGITAAGCTTRFDNDSPQVLTVFEDASLDGAVDAQDAGLDAGLADAGMADAGLDAGLADAGLADGGLDAGLADAGTLDAGLGDANVPDAGTLDAGLPDAGQCIATRAGLFYESPTGSCDDEWDGETCTVYSDGDPSTYCVQCVMPDGSTGPNDGCQPCPPGQSSCGL